MAVAVIGNQSNIISKYTQLNSENAHIIKVLNQDLKDCRTIIRKYENISKVKVCRITSYCPCMQCCGKTNGITATGTKAKDGRTVAANPDIFPYGTKIYIQGIGYRVVEDTGGGVRDYQIDVFVDDHRTAKKRGFDYAYVIAEE